MSDTLHAACMENMPFGVLILDGDKKIVYINSTLRRYLGLSGQTVGAGATITVLPATFLSSVIRGQRTVDLPGQPGSHPRTLQSWTELITTPSGKLTAYYSFDITEFHHAAQDRDRLAEELSRLTTRDAITGLPNRQALLQALEPLVSRSRRYSNPLSIIRLRIGNTASLDQQHGAGSTDAALVAISHLLRDQTRWADLIGRYSDDEFLLILPETSAENAQTLAEKLLLRLKELLVVNEQGKSFPITSRLGLAAWKKGDDSALLLSSANQAMEDGVGKA